MASANEDSPQSKLKAALYILESSNEAADLEKSIEILTQLSPKLSATCTDDISTSSLELLGVSYHLARAYLKLPTLSESGPNSTARKRNVLTANGYFDKYLRVCEEIALLDDVVVKEYHLLLELLDLANEGSSSSEGKKSQLTAGQVREMKIGRYQRKKSVEVNTKKLEGLQERRKRLDMAENDEMDGLDGEGLTRDLNLERLKLYAEESLEEMQSSKSELEMLEMAVQFEAMGGQNNQRDARMTHGNRTAHPNGNNSDELRSQQPLQLTQITQDPLSGQLQFNKQQISHGTIRNIGLPNSSLGGIQMQRQQIAEGVFKPSWNLPTMSLEELAERERADAIARSKSHKEAEARAKTMPRRYEQLAKDGMEDDADLVDKSAALDRKWDEWKEENPRGSGNKMSERGDRNF